MVQSRNPAGNIKFLKSCLYEGVRHIQKNLSFSVYGSMNLTNAYTWGTTTMIKIENSSIIPESSLWSSANWYLPYRFVFSRVSYKWNHRVNSLLGLTSSTWHNALKVQPCGHMWQDFPLFCGFVVFLMVILQWPLFPPANNWNALRHWTAFPLFVVPICKDPCTYLLFFPLNYKVQGLRAGIPALFPSWFCCSQCLEWPPAHKYTATFGRYEVSYNAVQRCSRLGVRQVYELFPFWFCSSPLSWVSGLTSCRTLSQESAFLSPHLTVSGLTFYHHLSPSESRTMPADYKFQGVWSPALFHRFVWV